MTSALRGDRQAKRQIEYERLRVYGAVDHARRWEEGQKSENFVNIIYGWAHINSITQVINHNHLPARRVWDRVMVHSRVWTRKGASLMESNCE